jgi:hypothetical protein
VGIELKLLHADNLNATMKQSAVVGNDKNKLELHSVVQWMIDVRFRVEKLEFAWMGSLLGRHEQQGVRKGRRKNGYRKWMD